MSSSSSRDEAISDSARGGGSRTLLIAAGVLLVLAVIGGAYYFISNGFGGGANANSNAASKARSYRSIAKTELRSEANQAAKLVVSLREGTTVSGVSAGNKDGVDWLEITAVDGTKGFAPKTLFKELGPSTASTEIKGGTRRIVTSATVNLRETPSMSGKILGVADGGTRMVSDGTIQSEGEDWLRVPIDGQTTVFIMQRFTTADDDAGSSEGFEGDAQAAIGVRGFATQIANVQATPLPDARVVRALQIDEEVRIIGQTNAGQAWYVLRLTDGSQGFAPRVAIRLDPNASRWVYPDGTDAPGPNTPKGSTTALTAEQLTAARATRQKKRAPIADSQNVAAPTQIAPKAQENSQPAPKTNEGPVEPPQGPEQLQPKEALPVPGPQ